MTDVQAPRLLVWTMCFLQHTVPVEKQKIFCEYCSQSWEEEHGEEP